ncbi:cobyric acid synthase [Acetobacter musti]|uniref:Cobyric acid synthase n=1 Tax=Acetobacter musti TaxID=864732 RepID=A0ABX0JNT7_9PROT|nr:cobyric acid synthase [Acetobacter musti]NHN84265.1 cobyric acid synthase [Acetobacter musti]
MVAIMVQGTGSDVGKSVLVAGLCRAFANRGLRVAPFKPQNMSNNAAVTADGGEIGRAQALQAVAARAEPVVDMNPVLLKPQSDRSSQLIVHGQMCGMLHSDRFREDRRSLLPEVLGSFRRLRDNADLVVVEGAGSPAEINLRDGDIANMGFALAADVPVILVGDIDRGGVIASVVGTKAVLSGEDSRQICGFIINKFRGDAALFQDGYRAIEELTGWTGLGLVPWMGAARRLPAEDAVVLEKDAVLSERRRIVACPVLPHIANFDDLDPLRHEAEIEVAMVPPGRPIPADAALIVLPGSKAVVTDMKFLRREGWDVDILAHYRQGGRILGICGGYQMLGRRIADPQGLEGDAEEMAGLGLLETDTELAGHKVLTRVSGVALGADFLGYEIHVGKETWRGDVRPFARLDDGRSDGAVSGNGRVMGTYCHGLLGAPGFRSALMAQMGVRSDAVDHEIMVNAALDEIAEVLERSIDLDGVLALAR